MHQKAPGDHHRGVSPDRTKPGVGGRGEGADPGGGSELSHIPSPSTYDLVCVTAVVGPPEV